MLRKYYENECVTHMHTQANRLDKVTQELADVGFIKMLLTERQVKEYIIAQICFDRLWYAFKLVLSNEKRVCGHSWRKLLISKLILNL